MTINFSDISNEKPLTFICGPCVIESEKLLLDIARQLQKAVYGRVPFIFKTSFDKANRQSLDSFRGLGIKEGLNILKKIKEQTGLPIITDVHESYQVEMVAEVVDMIQIPAFLCRQTDLLVAAAKSGKPINIKKGQFMSPHAMKSVVEKIREAGADHVMITERGYCFGYGNLVVDMKGLEEMKSFGVPIIFDATHSVQQSDTGDGKSGGQRQYVPALARAATAVGIAGLFIETHPNPEKALSDSATQWPINDLNHLINEVVAIDKVIKNK